MEYETNSNFYYQWTTTDHRVNIFHHQFTIDDFPDLDEPRNCISAGFICSLQCHDGHGAVANTFETNAYLPISLRGWRHDEPNIISCELWSAKWRTSQKIQRILNVVSYAVPGYTPLGIIEFCWVILQKNNNRIRITSDEQLPPNTLVTEEIEKRLQVMTNPQFLIKVIFD